MAARAKSSQLFALQVLERIRRPQMCHISAAYSVNLGLGLLAEEVSQPSRFRRTLAALRVTGSHPNWQATTVVVRPTVYKS